MLMPGMDGLELATRLHERVAELPTILASSVPRHDVASDPRWEGAGIGAVIVKPIKASALHGALAIVLDRGRRRGGAQRGGRRARPRARGTAPAPDPDRGGQRREPAARAAAAREARVSGRRRGQRARGGRGGRAPGVRPRPDGRADAGDGRRPGDPADPRAVGGRRAAVDRRDDRGGDAGRPRGLPRRRDERLRRQADPPAGADRRDHAHAEPAEGPSRCARWTDLDRPSTRRSSSGSPRAWAATMRSSPS